MDMNNTKVTPEASAGRQDQVPPLDILSTKQPITVQPNERYNPIDQLPHAALEQNRGPALGPAPAVERFTAFEHQNAPTPGQHAQTEYEYSPQNIDEVFDPILFRKLYHSNSYISCLVCNLWSTGNLQQLPAVIADDCTTLLGLGTFTAGFTYLALVFGTGTKQDATVIQVSNLMLALALVSATASVLSCLVVMEYFDSCRGELPRYILEVVSRYATFIRLPSILFQFSLYFVILAMNLMVSEKLDLGYSIAIHIVAGVGFLYYLLVYGFLFLNNSQRRIQSRETYSRHRVKPALQPVTTMEVLGPNQRTGVPARDQPYYQEHKTPMAVAGSRERQVQLGTQEGTRPRQVVGSKNAFKHWQFPKEFTELTAPTQQPYSWYQPGKDMTS